MRNPTIEELENLITTRVLGTRFGQDGVVRERFYRQDIARIFRLVANGVLEDLGLSEEYRVIANPVSGTFLIYKRPRRILCKLEIDGVYEGDIARRPKALLLGKHGEMYASTLRDLTDMKLMDARRKYA